MDKLDYLFYLCKQNGLYISIDLYANRKPTQAEAPSLYNLPTNYDLNDFKAMAAVDPVVFENWKDFARNLLTHVNPYTQLAWKDDPALFSICPINEVNLIVKTKVLTPYFEKWLVEHAIQPANEQDRQIQYNHFIDELQTNLAKRCMDFVHSLGTHASLAMINHKHTLALGLTRNLSDYVDNHIYWDHPQISKNNWNLPYRYTNKNSLIEMAESPRQVMIPRIFGKPYAITEFNFGPPNPYRSASGALMGAYAAFQDWDMVYRFNHSNKDINTQQPQPTRGFSTVTDPINLLSDRIAVLLFRRGDVLPSEQTAAYPVTRDCLDHPDALDKDKGQAPLQAQLAGLMIKTGSLVSHQKVADTVNNITVMKTDDPQNILAQLTHDGIIRNDQFDLNKKTFTSSTGQITLDAQHGALTIQTPRSLCLSLSSGQSGSAGILSAKNHEVFTTISLHSLDGKPLTESKRMVLFHLPDVKNTNMKFADDTCLQLDDWGTLPHLVRNTSTDIQLDDINDQLHVWAIDMSGKRIKQMPVKRTQGHLVFTAQTVQDEGGFLVYELCEK
jgi:hypothetical protein